MLPVHELNYFWVQTVYVSLRVCTHTRGLVAETSHTQDMDYSQGSVTGTSLLHSVYMKGLVEGTVQYRF